MLDLRKSKSLVLLLVVHIMVIPLILVITYWMDINRIFVGYFLYFYATVFVIILVSERILLQRLDINRRHSKLYKNIYKLLEISAEVDDFDAFFFSILSSAIDCVDVANKGSIMLLNQEKNQLNFVAAVGYDLNILKETYLNIEDTYLYKELDGNVNRSIVVNDPFGYNKEHFKKENMKKILKAGTDDVWCTLSTPIFYKGELYGMINIDSSMIDAYDQYDIEVMALFAAEIKNVLKLFETMEINKNYMNKDVLTGIYNRRYITDYLNKIEDIKIRAPYSIVMMDLNGLKKVNDTYGHDCGDTYLKSFTNACTAILPDDSIFGRYGGDEFIIIIRHCDHERAEHITAIIQEAVREEKILGEGHSIRISFSYGIAVYGEDSESVTDLLKISDDKMYKDKRMFYKNR